MTVKTGLRDIVLPRDGTGVCMRRGTTRYRGPLGGGHWRDDCDSSW